MKKHEIEESIIADLPPFNKKEFEEVRDDVIKFFKEHEDTDKFMLLSNKINYFTLFEKGMSLNTDIGRADKLLTFLNNDSFLESLGKLKVLKRTEDNNKLEIWIGDTFFLFFDADSFFVKF